ncbi:DUF3137 domain-containing protein [Demequina flava]|uniref:DUF3137 domain-containing protein n=1 Tax=Demequina flava TaxID=1095025 RepID=UPI000ADAFF51|nr:DUF3137 domain-containing protein [Demequina flava]
MMRRGGIVQWVIPCAFMAFGFLGVMTFEGQGVILGLAVAAVVLGVLWLVWDVWQASRHRDAYREFAASQGWDYQALSHAYSSRFVEYPFGTGSSVRQETLVSGSFNGRQCAAFVHVYESNRDRNGNSSVKVPHQVVLAELDVALPRLDLIPQGVAQTVATSLGAADIDVESYDFNRQWRVVCNDLRYAHSVLDPRMVERLLWADAVGTSIRIEGSAVYLWAPGRIAPADLASRLGVVTAIARRIPDHVLREFRDLGYGAGRRGEPNSGPMPGPGWATESGVLNGRRYTGIGVDADGDGVEDASQLYGNS